MKSLLRLRHWQLFLLVVIPFSWVSPSPLKEIVNSIGVVIYCLWIYSIGIYGQKRIKELGLIGNKLGLFKTNVLIIPILFILIVLLMPERAVESVNEMDIKTILYIPVAIYMIFASIYSIIYASKTLTTIELKSKVTFNDYGLNLFLFIVLIVGIWVIQPKLNKLISDN